MTAPLTERFVAACGQTAPLELELHGPDASPVQQTFPRPWVVLGRALRTDISLDDNGISQRHAYLQMLKGRVFAIDLESKSGLEVDGVKFSDGWLEPGQRLSVGPYHVQVMSTRPATLAEPITNPLLDRLPRSSSMSTASFDIFQGSHQLARWRLNRVLSLVGRSERCRVRLPDVSVSCVHCSVIASDHGIWVVDLLSRDGTRLNGKPVHLACLQEGDTLEIGPYRLITCYRNGPIRTISTTMDPKPTPPKPEEPRAMMLPPMPPVPPVEVEVREDNKKLAAMAGGEGGMLLPLVQQFGQMQQEMFDQFQRTMMMMMQMFTTMHQEQAALVREEMRQFQKATEELQAAQKELRERQSQPPPVAGRPPAPKPEMPASRWKQDAWPVGEVGPPPVSVPANGAGQGSPDDEEVHEWLTDRIAQLESERQTRWQRILGFLKST